MGFGGESRHTVDAKGRVFIPAKLRAEIGSTLILCVLYDRCIRAYRPTEWDELENRFSSALNSAMTASKARLRREVFRYKETVDLDSQGRILLPDKLREKVGITENVAIIGVSAYLEIWDPELLDSEEGFCNDENVIRSYEELGIS